MPMTTEIEDYGREKESYPQSKFKGLQEIFLTLMMLILNFTRMQV